MPRSTKSGGVYIEISGNIEPFKKQLELAQELAKKTSRDLQNATEGFFNEHQIKKITDSLSRNLLNVRATAISCQKDISLFGRHFEQIAQKIGLAGEQAKIFGKDIENALKNAKEKSLERSMRSLQQQIGLTDQAYMRLARSVGATEAAMKKASSVLGIRTFAEIKNEIKATIEAYKQLKQLHSSGMASANDLTRAHKAMVAQIHRLGDEIRGVNRELKEESKTVKTLFSTFKSSTAVFLGGFLTTHSIVQDLRTLTSGIIEATTAMDRLKLAYSSIFEGSNGGKQQLDYIYEQAQKTGQEFFSLAEAAKTFFAAGQNSTIKNEMNEIFESVNLAGAALQLNSVQMQRVYYAIGQMISKGKVSAEEMRQQLGEQLPGAFQMAAKAMNMTTAELDKMMADGKLMTEDFLPKFAKALKEQYGEAGAKAADTLQGALNRLSTELTLLKTSIVESKTIVKTVNSLTSAANSLRESLDSGAFRTWATTIGTTITTLTALSGVIHLVSNNFAKLKGIVSFLGGPWAIAISAAVGAISYFSTVLTESEKIQNKYKDSVVESDRYLEALGLRVNSVTKEYKSLAVAQAEQKLKEVNDDIKKLTDEIYVYTAGLNKVTDAPIESMKTLSEVYANFSHDIRTYHTADFNAYRKRVAELSGENKAFADQIDKNIKNFEILKEKQKELIGITDQNKAVVMGLKKEMADLASQTEITRQIMAEPWALNIDGVLSGIAALDAELTKLQIKNRDLQIEAHGGYKGSLFSGIFAGRSAEDIAKMQKAYKNSKGSLAAAFKAGGVDMSQFAPEELEQYHDIFGKERFKQFLISENNRLSTKPHGGGGSSISKELNALEDYNKLLSNTKTELESIEEKLTHSSIDKTGKKRIDILNKYKEELTNIDATINKMVNSKKITAAQGEELNKQQKILAEKKKQLALIELEEKEREQNIQLLQTQIGFYNELAELSGQYDVSAQLRMQLIDLEAEKFSKIANIPDELVSKWKEFKKLQASTDPFDGAYRGLKKFTAEYGDSAKQWESLSYNFAKGFEQNIHDMFDEFIDTGKISFDNMAQLFKNLLKQMAYQALVQPIVLSVVNGIAGAVYGGTTAANGAASGVAGIGGNGLTQMAGGMAQSYAMGKIGGSILDGVGNWFNSAAASLFPETFAATASQVAGIQASAASAGVSNLAAQQALQEVAMSGAAAPGVSNVAMNSGIAAASHMPTQTATQMLSSGWTMGAGLAGSLLGNYVLVPALGIKGGLGTSIGSTAGGALGGLGGAIAGATLIGGSFGGPIGAGLGALAGTVLGALGGSLFGGGYEDEPGYYINTYTDLTKKEGLAGYKQGTAIQNHRWDSFSDSTASAMRDKVARPLMTQLRENTVALHEQIVALGGKDLGESFFDAVRKNQGSGDKRTGKGGIELSDYFHIHGEWHETNSPDVEKWAEQIGEQYQKVIVKSIANMDMKPIAVAADGMVANTEEEIAIALAKAGSLISVGDAIEDEKLKESFEKGINKSLIAALKSIDTKNLGLTIDKSSLAGWQTAIQAMALWTEVNTTIENMLEPASEISVQFKSIGNQFETWKNSLEALGWQSKKINEIDKKRIEYVKKYADETMNGFEKQDEYITRVKEINEAFADVYKGMRDNGISQSDLNNVNSRRDAVLREYIDGILEPFRETDEIKKNIQSISDTFVSAIAAMKEASDTFTEEDIKNAQSKMSTALRKYVSSVTDSYKKTNTLQKSIDEINNTFDDLIAGMKAVGMNTKDLTNAEKQRSQALAQLISDTMKSYDQSLYLRYVSLNSGSDSSTYQLSQLVFTQQNELEDLANAIGKNNDEYKTTELIQQAEMLNTRINLLQNQLKNTLQNELTTATEILNTATSIRSTFESILRSLKQARQNLWTSDKNLATSRYDEANKQFNEVFAKAMSGDEEALKELPNIANTVLSLAKEQLNTRGEYDTAFYTISKKLKKAEDVAASQLLTAEKDIDVQQRLVDSLNAEINGLGNTVGDAMEQSSEALRGLITTYQTQLTDLLKTIAENSTTISDNTAKIALLNDGTSESKKAILETKSELMKYGEALGKGQEAGNYTSDYILQAIAANGMTFDEWYTKYGSKEIIEAAKNTGTVINSISDLHKITDAYDKLLVDKANALNSQMVSTATVAAGGWTADLVRAEIASRGMTVKEWYDKYGKSEGFLLGTKNNTGSLNETLKAQTSSVNMSFTSWEDLLQKKADAMNAGLTLAGKQAAGGWTADLVKSEIASRGMTVQEWYEKYGKSEGFLQNTSINTKTTGDNVKTYSLSEGEKILAVKTALMNMGQTLSAGQKSSGNTMQSVLAEIEASGMTFSEWYTKYGKKEIDEAATNAGYIVGSTASMDEYTQSLLSSQTGVLSGWLSDVNKSVKSLQLDPSITNNFTPGITFSPTINVKVDQNGNVTVDKTVNNTSTSTSSGKTTTTTTNSNNTSNNNTTTPKKISETVSSLSSTYQKALQTKADAMVQGYLLASGQQMKNYTPAEVLKMINDTGYTFADWYKKYGETEIKSLQIKTTKSTKYSSDYALLVAKADAMNKKKEQGRTNWRASTALAEIQNKGLTLASWYDKYGKAEGFYKGGITPKNRAYWVGEKGPELLMSPQNYGILSNNDSMELMRGNSQNIYTSTGSVTTLDGGDKETHNILKQLLRKLTSQEYKIEKMQRIFDTWNHEGLPATATA